MLMIRFARIGKKKQPTYRLVVSEKGRDLYGKSLEIVGNYNPRTKAAVLDTTRIEHWLSKGAQTSETVHNLFVSQGIIKGKKVPVTHLNAQKKAELAKKKADEQSVKAQPAAETPPSETPEAAAEVPAENQ